MAELKLDENRDLVIYGAGFYAEKAFEYLSLRGVWEIVRYVVVSDGEPHASVFHKVKVVELSEVSKEISKHQIIIAISPKHSDDVLDNLKHAGITDCIRLTPEFIEGLIEEYGRLCERFPVQRNKIFFDVFNGSGYTCNCKYIAERIITMCGDCEMVWDLVENVENSLPNKIKAVIRDTPEYYYELYTSSVAVFNATINPNIQYKKRKQYFINTWHGIGPFKKVGKDVNKHNHEDYVSKAYQRIRDLVDLMTAASDHCIDVYRNSIGYQGEIQKWGYPRNDVFFNDNTIRDDIRRKYGIEKDKRIILYAPTYRYDLQGAEACEVMRVYNLEPRSVVDSLEKRYGGEFIFLYRFHHIIYKSTNVDRNIYGYGIDVTTHPDMQELLVAADVLITDWSSSIWDFSLARRKGKRVFLYHNDVERANELNGFYLPPEELPFPKGHTTEELCRVIETYDEEQYMRDADSFFEKYGSYDDGHASERVAERIMDVIHHPEKYGKA